MNDFSISDRYAETFLLQAEKTGILERALGDVKTVLEIFTKAKELKAILNSPIIKTEKKINIITNIFSDYVQDNVIDFLKFVIHKKREAFIINILKRIIEIRNLQLGLLNIKVTTASDLSARQHRQLVERLENFTKQKVELTTSLDEKIIGGFIARIGDKVLDASVKHKFELLKARLLEG